MLIYINWLFRIPVLNRFSGITLWPFIFVDRRVLSDSVRNDRLVSHEWIHWAQQLVCYILGGLIFAGVWAAGVHSLWLLLIPFLSFYVLYVLNWVWLRVFRGQDFFTAYRNIWFEKQARRLGAE